MMRKGVGGKDWAELRARLESARGPRYWRSLEEIAETDEFQKLLEDEFPSQASEWNDPLGRRRFLKLMGASLALAGVSSCTRQPAETIVPFARTVEATIPGRPLYFATAASLGGFATGGRGRQRRRRSPCRASCAGHPEPPRCRRCPGRGSRGGS